MYTVFSYNMSTSHIEVYFFKITYQVTSPPIWAKKIYKSKEVIYYFLTRTTDTSIPVASIPKGSDMWSSMWSSRQMSSSSEVFWFYIWRQLRQRYSAPTFYVQLFPLPFENLYSYHQDLKKLFRQSAGT